MMVFYKCASLVIAFLIWAGITFAQEKKAVVSIDTLKAKLKQSVKVDSAKINKLKHADQLVKDKLKKTINIDTAKINKIKHADQLAKAKLKSALAKSPLAKAFAKDSVETRKVILTDFSVGDAAQYVNGPANSPTPNFLNQVSFSGQLSIYKIPIDLDLVNNFNPLNDFKLDQNLFKFDLAKPNFQQLYQADIQKYKNLKDKRFLGMSAQNYLKKGLQDKIQKNLPEQITNNKKVMAYLNNPNAIKELLSMNEAQVQAKLTSVMNDVKTDLKNKGEGLYDAKRDSLTRIVDGKVEELTSYVQSVKQDLDENGLDEEKIEFLEKFINNKVTERDLEALLITQMNSQPKFKDAQKVYSKIKEFQAGNFGNQLPGSIMNRDLFLNGVNLAVKTSRGPVTVGLATNKDLGQAKDVEYTRSSFSSPRLYTYLSIPTTNFSFGSGKLSWVGRYDKQYGNTSTMLATSVPRSNMVFTISQNLNFHKAGMLTVDLSKSNVQYSNLVNGPEVLMADRTTMGNYFKDDLFETMSLGFKHNIEEKKMGLNSNVYFSYSGIGFQNPGAQSNTNMNMRFGGNIKKNFFKNKLTFYVRGDMKNTPISAENNSHWKNYNVQLDSRIRLSRAYTLSFKYLENGIDKVGTGQELPVYASRKLQTDFNANFKLFGKSSFSHVSLAKQNMDNQNVQTTISTNFIQANYTQSVVFKDFSLNGNVFYNKQLTVNPFLGDMLNSDVACQFSIFKSVSLSSGLTYLNNQNIAKQVGIRQNIQAMVKKHFEMSAYLDVRKNLITPLYPDLFSKARAEFSLRYYLDKQ